MPESEKNMDIVEDDEGDVDHVLDQEAEIIKKQENDEKAELIKHLQSYKIKVFEITPPPV